jgi:hypothetical protein
MNVYHGSNMEVDKPELRISHRALDFGAGFYVTFNQKQAIEFAHKVVIRSQRLLSKPGIATVSEYDFDMDTAEKTLKILRFEAADKEWLSFVVDNRRGKNPYNDYDVIIGAVADDNVYAVIGYYEEGAYTEEMAINALKIKKLFMQMVLKTEKALNLLSFVKSEIY